MRYFKQRVYLKDSRRCHSSHLWRYAVANIRNVKRSAFFDYHQEKGAKATILTAFAEDPTGYGRVIRDELGIVEKIVEQKDATHEEARVQEINTGTYCFDNKMLFDALTKVGNKSSQGEYYLPDVIEIMKDNNQIVAAYTHEKF